jgi:hypothetical protein
MVEPRSGIDWDNLISLIREGRCTPVIGAGASAPTLPLAAQLARQWAEEFNYPLADKTDLARVAQFVATDRDDWFPKELLQEQFDNVASPDFSQPDEPHAALADLPLPIYITTNYDPFMFEALKSRGKDVRREFPRWNRHLDFMGQESVFDGGYKPTPDAPLVYHLYGHTELVESMVLTEADHLDFLVRLTRDQDLLPPAIRIALAGTALLFVGYSLTDWSFRIMLRGLAGSLGASLGYLGLAVQLAPTDLRDQAADQAQSYLERYLAQIPKIGARIYWGSVRQFVSELRRRWEETGGLRRGQW